MAFRPPHAAPKVNGMVERYRVNIGMPVHNGERFLSAAIDSLLAQTYEDFRLIISDNGSVDNTQDICSDYQSRDRRILYYRSAANQGAPWNFHRTLDLAEGEYFMWAAHDDLWEPTFVATMVQLLDFNPQAALAFSAFNNIDEKGVEFRTYPHLFELRETELFDRLRNYVAQPTDWGKANPIYGMTKKNILQESGGFRVWRDDLWGNDMLVVFRIFSFGFLALSPELLFHKRLILQSPTHYGKSLVGRLAERYTNYQATMQNWNAHFDAYSRIIQTIDTLTPAEKTKLEAIVREQADQVRRKETFGFLLSPIVHRLLMGRRYLTSLAAWHANS